MKRFVLLTAFGLIACTGTVSLGTVPDDTPAAPVPVSAVTRGYPIRCGIGERTIHLDSTDTHDEDISYVDGEPVHARIALTPIDDEHTVLTMTSYLDGVTQKLVLDRWTPPAAQTVRNDWLDIPGVSLNGGTRSASGAVMMECFADGATPASVDAASFEVACAFAVMNADGTVESSKTVTLTPSTGEDPSAIMASSSDGPNLFTTNDVRAGLFGGSASTGHWLSIYVARPGEDVSHSDGLQALALIPHAPLVNAFADRTVTGQISVALEAGRTFQYSCYAP